MPTTGLITCTLAGTPIAFDRTDTAIGLSQFTITDRLGEIPNVATGRVRGLVPSVGMELIAVLTGSSTRIFAGHVIAVHQVSIAKAQDLAFDIQAIDYTWLLNRRKVTKRYTSTTAGAVLADLISSFTSGFTGSAVETAAGNTAIDEITFTFEEFTTALTRLAKRIGAYWYCDYLKDIHFFFSETGSNPTPLTVSHPSLEHQSVNVSTDLSQVITRVLHEGMGSTAVVSRVPGDTTIPVVDDAPFNAAGGTVVSGPQRITYTGLGTFTEPNGTWQLVPATSSQYFSVCWSPALAIFVAVGVSGTVYTSPDGLVWTSRTAAEANRWEGVCWSPELALFVAVSSDGTNRVMTSPNGTTWTARSAAAANSWQGVCWSPDLTLFCAVSSDGTSRVMTSPNGTTWTSRTASSAQVWARIAWSPQLDLFAAVANATGTTLIMTSPDGITWTDRSHSSCTPWNITWADDLGLFVICCDDRFLYSSNGTSWTLGAVVNSARGYRGICWAKELGILIAIAHDVGVTDGIVVSRDGVLWDTQPTPTTLAFQAIAWGPEVGRLVAVSGAVASTSHLVSVGDNFPQLEGIPASGAGSIVTNIAAGADVNLLVTVNDTTAQTALAALIGGDGITEDYLQDRRLSEDEATARATAHLDLRKNPEVTLRYRCRDILTRSGRTITVLGYEGTVLADAPVGYWRLGERSGTTADDLTSGNHNGTYTGSPTLDVPGATSDQDGGVTLNGSTQYVTMGDVATFEFTGAFAVECWAKWTSSSTMMLVSKADASKGWRLYVASGQVNFDASTSAPATIFAIATTNTYNDGAWHYIVGTWDGATGAGHVAIYVDGVSAATGTVSAGTIATNTANFLIGVLDLVSFFFSGSIDEVAVYNFAFSGTNLSTHYAARRWITGNLGDLTIQDVTISDFSQKNPNLFPTYDVVASSTRFSFEDLLRRVPRDLGP